MAATVTLTKEDRKHLQTVREQFAQECERENSLVTADAARSLTDEQLVPMALAFAARTIEQRNGTSAA